MHLQNSPKAGVALPPTVPVLRGRGRGTPSSVRNPVSKSKVKSDRETLEVSQSLHVHRQAHLYSSQICVPTSIIGGTRETERENNLFKLKNKRNIAVRRCEPPCHDLSLSFTSFAICITSLKLATLFQFRTGSI